MTLVLIALGGALGAPLRYLVDRAVQGRHDSLFPWASAAGAGVWRRRARPQIPLGTFAVNVAGSLLLGLVAGAGGVVSSLVGIGFCGALTTYSTFSYETLRLLEERAAFYALANVVTSLGAGLGAAWLGLTISAAVG